MKLVRRVAIAGRAAMQAALGRHADVLPWTWTAMNYEEDMPKELEESEDMDVASDSSADRRETLVGLPLDGSRAAARSHA
eukprot:366030-Chlamydomonas_euryale.AAC.15